MCWEDKVEWKMIKVKTTVLDISTFRVLGFFKITYRKQTMTTGIREIFILRRIEKTCYLAGKNIRSSEFELK